MPYYAVASGDMLRCVQADNAKAACVKAVKELSAECQNAGDMPKPGMLFEAHELGTNQEQHWFVGAKIVMREAGFELVLVVNRN